VVLSKTYRVVLEGVKQGFAREFVVGELATLFKRSAEQVEPLLDTRGTVVKKGIDLPTARKYQDALERRGCSCSIEAEGVFAADATQVLRRYSSKEHEEFFASRAASSGGAAKKATPAGLKMEKMDAKPEPLREEALAPAANPYATPAASVADLSVDNDETIRNVAKYQRMLLVSILATLAGNAFAWTSPGILAGVIILGVGIVSLWAVYRLCRALELTAVLWVILMFIPLLNLLGMLYINQKATGFLKAQGLSVGLLGAKM
jgi:hypothetical protein